jgi:sec-independent protein translocase protein TatB
MFDIGWSEMLVIAIVMIVVVGPKDLPRMLRTFGRTTAKLRAMAGDFQKQFNDALKEADLEDFKKSVDELRGLNPANEIRKQLNPFDKAAQDVRSGLDSALKPAPSSAAVPAASAAHTAEPLKNGATEMPGVGGPTAMPAEAPVFPAVAEPSMPIGAGADAGSAAAVPPAAKRAPRPKSAATGAPAKAAAKPKPAAKPKTAATKKKTAGIAS